MKRIVLILVITLFISGCSSKMICEEGYVLNSDKDNCIVDPYEEETGLILDEDGHTIIGYDVSFGLDVIIPRVIKGNEINIIGEAAFKELGITSVTIPSTITTIRDDAFYGNEISTLLLENTLEYLGSHSFADNQIDALTITNMYVAGYLPFEMNPLTTINFIGNGLYNTYMQLGFSVEDSDVELVEVDGFLFAWEYSTLVGYDSSYGLDVVIPNSIDVPEIGEVFITDIGNYTFNNLGINSVTLPNMLFNVGSYAFSNNNLTELVIPVNEENISLSFERGAFMNNDISELDVEHTFHPSKDLFKGNTLTSITVNGEEGFYVFQYEFMGMMQSSSFEEEYTLTEIKELKQNHPPYHMPFVEVNDVIYYINFEVDQHSTNTSQKIDIYKEEDTNLVLLKNIIIEDHSYGYIDSILLKDGRVLVLAYQIPLVGDSDTYLPGTIIEFSSDLTTYELHILDNQGMRIPRKLTENHNGDIGIIGEGTSYMDSSFMVFDSDYQKVSEYICNEDIRCRYTEITARNDEFLVSGSIGDSQGCVNGSCYDIILHIFDENGLIDNQKFETEGSVETMYLNVSLSGNTDLISRTEYNTLVFRRFDSENTLILEKEYLFGGGMISDFSTKIDNYYVFVANEYQEGSTITNILFVDSDFEISKVVSFGNGEDINIHLLTIGSKALIIQEAETQKIFLITEK